MVDASSRILVQHVMGDKVPCFVVCDLSQPHLHALQLLSSVRKSLMPTVIIFVAFISVLR